MRLWIWLCQLNAINQAPVLFLIHCHQCFMMFLTQSERWIKVAESPFAITHSVWERHFGINLLPFDPQIQMVTLMSSSVNSRWLILAFTYMMLNDTIDNMTSFKFILSIVLPMSQNMCYLCPRSIHPSRGKAHAICISDF